MSEVRKCERGCRWTPVLWMCEKCGTLDGEYKTWDEMVEDIRERSKAAPWWNTEFTTDGEDA
jgi:hypothetical protein